VFDDPALIYSVVAVTIQLPQESKVKDVKFLDDDNLLLLLRLNGNALSFFKSQVPLLKHIRFKITLTTTVT
jgi:hypothetical protein